MTYCTRCDRPLRDGEKCGCGLPERILLPPEMRTHDKRFLTAAVSSFIAVMAAIVFFVPPMMGFNKESRQAIAEKAAAEISETAQEAVKELIAEGHDLSGDYIISYGLDFSLCDHFDNDFFEEKFRCLAGEDMTDDYDFFIRVKNGEVEYTAVSNSWYSPLSTIGTYPPSPAKEMYYHTGGGVSYKVDNLIHLREQFIPCD